jgi:hypothetical protein
MIEGDAPQRTAVVVRNIHGVEAVEWFLFLAVATILITRLYLRVTGYPQIGRGQLHIAHALWGGALMILALLISWLFLGSTPRLVSIILGGIGFGLFLDEVGKFVTKTNNYFYRPSAEIMYVVVVMVLLIARIVRDLKKPTAPEALANAAAIATDGIGHGLPARLRSQAAAHLDVAAGRGADEQVIEHIRGLIDVSKDTPDVLTGLRIASGRLMPRFLLERWVVTVVGWILVAASAMLLVAWTLARVHDPATLAVIDHYFELGHSGPVTRILVITGAATLVLALPATIAWTRASTALWPLRWLRLAAMVFTFSNALVDFALEGFSALINLGLGLIVLAVVSRYLVSRTAEHVGQRSQTSNTRTGPVQRGLDHPANVRDGSGSV